jgi:hypothetical protein
LHQTEQRLGFRPRFATFDAAFDAFYVYDYFHRGSDEPNALDIMSDMAAYMSTGFAAVPFSEKGGYTANGRQFSPEGLPICKAGLPMPLKFTFTDRTTCLVEQGGRKWPFEAARPVRGAGPSRGHERGKYVCPLRFPTQTAPTCPVNHKRWKQGGCTSMRHVPWECPPLSARGFAMLLTPKAMAARRAGPSA